MTDGLTNSFVDAVALSDLPPGSQKSLYVGRVRLLLCHTGKKIYAVEDKCTHAFQPLFGGEIENDGITCPKHGACFDLASGVPRNDVSTKPIKVFITKIHNDRVAVDLSSSAM